MASEDSKLIVDTIQYSQKQLDAIEKKKEKELDVYRKKVVDNWNDQRQRTIGDKKEHDRQWKEDAALLVAADKRDKDRDARESAAKMKERAAEERNAQLLEGLTGFAKMRELGRQKAEKLKKAAAGKVKDWGVKKLAQVKEGALKLLDMLKKGLGLAALWALFWFIKNQPWKSLSEEVKKNIQIITDGIMGISGWLGSAQF